MQTFNLICSNAYSRLLTAGHPSSLGALSLECHCELPGAVGVLVAHHRELPGVVGVLVAHVILFL